MPQIDLSKPMTFTKTLDQLALILNCTMIALRDEMNFHDNDDPTILAAASTLSSMLEDAHAESVVLADRLERRALGMT